jgi:hypothetical protein
MIEKPEGYEKPDRGYSGDDSVPAIRRWLLACPDAKHIQSLVKAWNLWYWYTHKGEDHGEKL